MSLSRKAKGYISCLAFAVTCIVCIQYVFYTKSNAIQVYSNGKPICFVKNQSEFEKIEKETKSEFTKRFGATLYKDNIKFEKIRVNDGDLKDTTYIKNSLIKDSNLKVNALMMKSDGKKVGILANESEMKDVLDKIKNHQYQKNKEKQLILRNKITYVSVEAPIREVNTVDEIYKAAVENDKKALITFNSLVNETRKSPSRSTNAITSMAVPSQGAITSSFGARWGKKHDGVDIGANMGSDILSAMEGRVCYAKWSDGYGNLIQIDHGNGIKTFYGHCSSIWVKIGQNVKRGEKIGEVGSTGRSTGPHLHFEVRVEEVPQNPLNYIK